MTQTLNHARNLSEAELRAQLADPAYETSVRGFLSGKGRPMVGPGALAPDDATLRAMGITTGPSGAFWVPDLLYSHIVRGASAASPLLDAARQAGAIVETTSGGDLAVRVYDDSSVEGEVLPESGQASQTDIEVGLIKIPTYQVDSNLFLVSLQLVSDGGPAVIDGLAEALGRRWARRVDRALATGAAPNEPPGLVIAAPVAVSAAATGSVTADELENLIDAADPEWRFSSTAMFAMRSATFSAIRKLKGGDGQYLAWQPDPSGLSAGTILGRRVVLDSNIPAMAASAKSVIYYDTRRFVVRLVVPSSLTVFTETFARNLQVGYMHHQRVGAAMFQVASTPSAVALQQAA